MRRWFRRSGVSKKRTMMPRLRACALHFAAHRRVRRQRRKLADDGIDLEAGQRRQRRGQPLRARPRCASIRGCCWSGARSSVDRSRPLPRRRRCRAAARLRDLDHLRLGDHVADTQAGEAGPLAKVRRTIRFGWSRTSPT